MIQSVLHTIIYSNTWVAICFSVLFYGVAKITTNSPSLLYALFGFFSTLAAYSFHRYVRLRQLALPFSVNARFAWMGEHKSAITILFVLSSGIAFVLSCVLLSTLWQWLLLSSCAILVFLYAFPLKTPRFGLRQLPYLKIYLISAVWTLLCLLPGFAFGANLPLWLPFILFLATLAQVIPFDIRDVTVDAPNMRTLPQIFGVLGSRLIASGILFGICAVLLLETSLSLGLVCYVFTAILGYWIALKKNNQLALEFLWELPMLFLGIHFATI